MAWFTFLETRLMLKCPKIGTHSKIISKNLRVKIYYSGYRSITVLLLLWRLTMTSRYYISCPKCLENIAKINTKAAKLWMDLCALKLQVGDILQFESSSKEINLLENLGYIITTEKNKSKILLKLKGNFYERTSNDIFCIESCSHE